MLMDTVGAVPPASVSEDAPNVRAQGTGSISTGAGAGSSAPSVVHSIDFALVPGEAILDRSVTAEALRLLNLLCLYANKTGKAWPNQKRVAAELGLSPRAIRRATSNLVEAGHLLVQKAGTGHNLLYVIPWRERRSKRTATSPSKSEADADDTRSGRQRPTHHIEQNYRTERDSAADAAPPVAFRDRKDYRAGFAFGEVFRKWYSATYQRPHASLMLQDAKGLTALLKKVGRDRALVHELSASPAEEIIIGACIVAERNKGQLWFIRNAPLDIGTILNGKHWQRIWDRVIEEGQNLGRIAKTG